MGGATSASTLKPTLEILLHKRMIKTHLNGINASHESNRMLKLENLFPSFAWTRDILKGYIVVKLGYVPMVIGFPKTIECRFKHGEESDIGCGAIPNPPR